MDGREEFLTEDYFRYSAECRRLARLSSNPQRAIDRRRQQAAVGARVSDWLGEVRGWMAPAAPLAARLARSR